MAFLKLAQITRLSFLAKSESVLAPNESRIVISLKDIKG